MGDALEWEPWNWDLWNTPREPDDEESSLDLIRKKLREADEESWPKKERGRRLSTTFGASLEMPDDSSSSQPDPTPYHRPIDGL